jgi:ATP synthase protein I
LPCELRIANTPQFRTFLYSKKTRTVEEQEKQEDPIEEIKEDVNPKRQVNNYAKYSGLAIQMGAIIGGFVWLGTFLDKKYNDGGQAWTIGLSLFGVAGALYIVLKGIIKMTKDT